MSAMSFYQFFPNKRALLRFIWEDIFDEVFGKAEQSAGKHGTPLEKLQAYMESIVHFWLKHTDHYRIIYLQEEVVGSDDHRYAESSHFIERMKKPARWCSEAISQGLVRLDDPALVLQILIVQVHGLAQSLITVPEMGWVSSKRLIRESIANALRGLKK